jgi:hypothetical protein
MKDLYIGLATTAAVILLFESLRFLEKRLLSAFTLVGIAFIYIGFTWRNTTSLIYSIIAVAIFIGLSYFGYKNNFIWIVIGLLLHGVWDVLFPFISDLAPHGYDIFCITIDVLLAVYVYFRVRPLVAISNRQ